MSDQLYVFVDQPFDESTKADAIDLFEDLDGVEDTFTLANKFTNKMAATLQANNSYYYFYNFGYTKTDSTDFVTEEPPTVGSTLIVQGTVAVSFDAYDQTGIDGNANSNIKEVEFYVGNIDDITTKKFLTPAGETGITVQFVNLLTGYGIADSCFSIARATPDLAGTPMTYVSGEYTLPNDFTAEGTLAVASTSSPGVTVLIMQSADEAAAFPIGEFVVIDKGGPHEEIVQVLDVDDDTISVAKTDFDHDIDETVFHCAVKMWGKMTIPVNLTSNTAKAYLNIAFKIKNKTSSRLV